MIENVIGRETGIGTEIGIGNETGTGTVAEIEVATEETFPLAREHIKSLGSQLRTLLLSNLIANPTVCRVGEEAVGGMGTMEVAPGGASAGEIMVMAVGVEVEVRVEAVLRGVGQGCLYVAPRRHRRRMGIRAGKVGIGGWFSV